MFQTIFFFTLLLFIYFKSNKKKNEPRLQQNQCCHRRPLTNLSVEDLFLSVANWFNDLKEGLEESEVTQPPGLVIELLPLCFLQAGGKNHKLCWNTFTFFFYENRWWWLLWRPPCRGNVLEKSNSVFLSTEKHVLRLRCAQVCREESKMWTTFQTTTVPGTDFFLLAPMGAPDKSLFSFINNFSGVVPSNFQLINLDGHLCLPDIQIEIESSYLCNTDKDVGRLLL